VKRPVCNSQFGRISLVAVIAAAMLAGAIFLLVQHWAPLRVVERQHARLIDAIERRSAKRLDRLLAESYRDQWDFDREQAALALSDIGSQFFVLTVTPVDAVTERNEAAEITVRHRVEVQGQGSPIASEILRTANRLKAPFEFRWRRQSLWPGDWKLVSIANPDLPDEIYGYEPGDLRRAMGGEDP
jgi:hypothetical protein